MHTCIIIDDEAHSIDSLKGYIDKVPELKLLDSYINPLVALEEIRKGKWADIVFLDIDMPELSGIEVAELLPKGIAVIFTTGHSRFALQAFQLDAFDFLLKPFSYSMFFKSVTKVLERIGKAPTKEDIQSIFINPGTKGKIVQLLISEISHIEALNHSVRIYTPFQNLVSKVNLKEIQAKIPLSKFARVHRSFLVNVDLIRSIDATQVVLANDIKIPLGDAYKKALLERIRGKIIAPI